MKLIRNDVPQTTAGSRATEQTIWRIHFYYCKKYLHSAKFLISIKYVSTHLSTHLGIHASTKVSINRGGCSIHENRRGQEGASLGVQFAQNCEQDDDKGDDEELISRPQKGGKDHGNCGRAKYVAMNLFPTVLIAKVAILE